MADSNWGLDETVYQAEKRLAVEALKKRREENEGKIGEFTYGCRYCYAPISESDLQFNNNCCGACDYMKQKGWLF